MHTSGVGYAALRLQWYDMNNNHYMHIYKVIIWCIIFAITGLMFGGVSVQRENQKTRNGENNKMKTFTYCLKCGKRFTHRKDVQRKYCSRKCYHTGAGNRKKRRENEKTRCHD